MVGGNAATAATTTLDCAGNCDSLFQLSMGQMDEGCSILLMQKLAKQCQLRANARHEWFCEPYVVWESSRGYETFMRLVHSAFNFSSWETIHAQCTVKVCNDKKSTF